MSDIERVNGRFAPGNRGGPGRPPRSKEEEMLAAVTEACSPDELKQLIKDAIGIAREQKSARSMLAIAEFVTDRTLGRPAVKVQSGQSKFVEMLALLGSNEVMADDVQRITQD